MSESKSEATMQTYRFSTFQELMDRVPSGRIHACFDELGKTLQVAKATVELHYFAAEELARLDGKQLPPIPERVIDLPAEFEWIDDGKGELIADMRMPNGDEFLSVKLSRDPDL